VFVVVAESDEAIDVDVDVVVVSSLDSRVESIWDKFPAAYDPTPEIDMVVLLCCAARNMRGGTRQ